MSAIVALAEPFLALNRRDLPVKIPILDAAMVVRHCALLSRASIKGVSPHRAV
jgi:hypothetical protein